MPFHPRQLSNLQKYETQSIVSQTFRFGEDQFDGSTWERLGGDYIDGFSGLDESEETIEDEDEDSAGGDAEDEIADVEG